MNFFKRKIDERALENFVEILMDKAYRWETMSQDQKDHAKHWIMNYFRDIFK